MALQTFLNLKQTRQDEILMVCFQEFAIKRYQSVSLSDIIKKLGLAKGSFYRYFVSKKKLYAYLIQNATERRLSKLDQLVADPNVDFFDLIEANFMDKIQFDIEQPIIGGFLYQIMLEKDESEVSEIIGALFQTIIQQTSQLIMLPKYNVQLLSVDPEMLAFQIFHTQLWLYDYVAFKHNLNIESNIKQGLPAMNVPKGELKIVIKNAVKMLRNGIAINK